MSYVKFTTVERLLNCVPSITAAFAGTLPKRWMELASRVQCHAITPDDVGTLGAVLVVSLMTVKLPSIETSLLIVVTLWMFGGSTW